MNKKILNIGKSITLLLLLSFFPTNCILFNKIPKIDKNENIENNNFILRLGGVQNDSGYSIQKDKYNNIIVAGIIAGNGDYNGDGIIVGDLENSSENYFWCWNLFICKFDPDGNYLWGKKLANNSHENYFSSLTVDNSNNIIITGSVYNNADLNGDGIIQGDLEISSNGYCGFISKFDSSGVFLWAKRLKGTAGEYAFHPLTTDKSNNIFITGAGLLDNEDNSSDNSTGDYINKLDPSGNFLWAKELFNKANSIALDNSNNLVISFRNYINKLNSSGDLTWEKFFEANCNSIRIDRTDNIFLTGYVNGNADLNGDGIQSDNGIEICNSSVFGNNDIFISKFNSSGNFMWIKRLGGLYDDYGMSITSDNSNNVLITGYVSGNADLNGDSMINTEMPETTSINSSTSNIFIIKFNSSGSFIFSKRIENNSVATGYSIITDNYDSILITGTLGGSCDLDEDGIIASDTAENSLNYGLNDVIILKYDKSGNF